MGFWGLRVQRFWGLGDFGLSPGVEGLRGLGFRVLGFRVSGFLGLRDFGL